MLQTAVMEAMSISQDRIAPIAAWKRVLKSDELSSDKLSFMSRNVFYLEFHLANSYPGISC